MRAAKDCAVTRQAGDYSPRDPVDVVCRQTRIEYRIRDAAIPGAGLLLAFAEHDRGIGIWWVSLWPGAPLIPEPSDAAAHEIMSAQWIGPKVRLLHE